MEGHGIGEGWSGHGLPTIYVNEVTFASALLHLPRLGLISDGNVLREG